MSYLRALFILLVLVFISFAQTGDLKKVNYKQLRTLTKNNEFVIVLVESDINEAAKEISQKMKEELEVVAHQLGSLGNLKFVSFPINVDSEHTLINELEIVDLPCILIFRDDKVRTYFGQRIRYTLLTFINDLITRDPVKLIESKQSKNLFTQDDTVKVVGFFEKQGGKEYEEFRKAAKQFQGDVGFGLVLDEKVAKSFKLSNFGELALLKPGERAIILDNDSSNKDIITWVKENQTPLWEVLTYENIYRIWQNKKANFVAFVRDTETADSKAALSVFKTLAKEHAKASGMIFAVVDATKYEDFARNVGVDEAMLPTFVIFQLQTAGSYFFPKNEQKLNLKSTKKWIEDFLAGKLVPTEIKVRDGVVPVTLEEFNQVVSDEGKEVVALFTSSTCDKCEEVFSHYQPVSQLLSPIPTITFLRYNLDESNPPEGVDVSDLPLLLFYPTSDDRKNPAKLTGSIDRLEILRFVMSNQRSFPQEVVDELNYNLDNLK